MLFPRAAGYAALTRFLRVMLTTGAGVLCLLAYRAARRSNRSNSRSLSLEENLRLEALCFVMANLAGSFGPMPGAKVETLRPRRLHPSGQARKITTLPFIVNNFNTGQRTTPKAVWIGLRYVRA